MFDIYMDDKIVGTAQVQRIGLYYQFDCCCKPPDNDIYRVWICDGSTETDLGICVPERDTSTLRKRMPVKYLSGTEFKFILLQKDRKPGPAPSNNSGILQNLDKLEYAKLSEKDGQQTIVISPAPNPQDSDLNP